MYRRYQINIRLPLWKIESVKNHCKRTTLSFTAYLEKALDRQMKIDNIDESKPEVLNTWNDNIDEMPLYPKIKEKSL